VGVGENPYRPLPSPTIASISAVFHLDFRPQYKNRELASFRRTVPLRSGPHICRLIPRFANKKTSRRKTSRRRASREETFEMATGVSVLLSTVLFSTNSLSTRFFST